MPLWLRDLTSSLCKFKEISNSKLDSYILENGKNSLSKYFLKIIIK